MNIFEFENYRLFLKKALLAMPKHGYGQSRKLAVHLEVSTTLISQILSEQKHFTLDQAHLATEFLGLSDLESRYFLVLVQIEKAANLSYRRKLEKDLKHYKDESQKIEKRLTHKEVLNDEQKAVFYSHWQYSAIRMLTSINGFDSIDAIANYFGLPKKTVSESLQFLEMAGLIVKDKNKYMIGPLSTHVGSDSPWVKLHHNNWRLKAMDYASYPNPQKLHYTSPMTLSSSDVEKIRAKIVQMIEEVGKVVDESPAEQLMCLNVDWFHISPR